MERTNRPVVGGRVSRANVIKASGETVSIRHNDNIDPEEQKRLSQSVRNLMWWYENGTFVAGVPPALYLSQKMVVRLRAPVANRPGWQAAWPSPSSSHLCLPC
jgi:hypothetical protein